VGREFGRALYLVEDRTATQAGEEASRIVDREAARVGSSRLT
jgi:hypothetical protein